MPYLHTCRAALKAISDHESCADFTTCCRLALIIGWHHADLDRYIDYCIDRINTNVGVNWKISINLSPPLDIFNLPQTKYILPSISYLKAINRRHILVL
jgi:hypothetical protein